jgi:DUF218 domain-containing protein
LNIALFKRKSVLLPTLAGWALLLAVAASVCLTWWFEGESFLSRTQRQPAQVLVVEGWIGPEGIREARAEFARGTYDFVVTTSGLSEERWSEQHWSFAREAQKILLGAGVPRERLICAPPLETKGQRTYQSAVAVLKALQERNIHPKYINVYTMAVHSRRSRLVFAKVFRGYSEVGVVSWIPIDYDGQPWWQSSERASDFLKETVAYIYEATFGSGRWILNPAG